jgi:hypothetical protein
VSPVRYELGFCIPADGILHGHCREELKSYIEIEEFGESDTAETLPGLNSGKCGGARLLVCLHVANEGRAAVSVRSFHNIGMMRINSVACLLQRITLSRPSLNCLEGCA